MDPATANQTMIMLRETFGPVAETIWESAIRQQILEGYCLIIVALIWTALYAGVLYLTWRVMDFDNDEKVGTTIIASLFYMAGLLPTLVLATFNLYNTEWQAVEAILRAASGR